MKINTSAFFLLAAFAGLAGCATNQTSSTIADTHAASTHANATAAASPAKSPKRGVAYDLASTADLQALSRGSAGGTTGARSPAAASLPTTSAPTA